ncbi:DUF2630 family protein [Wenjunlia tyrosinilytica]|jgi:hypothetical protein|uniref:DUF2630 family protein n=1 Tax=Wenjunlia tyrosinilytica TaxID=1544741 RepID=A0A918DXU2_9ACTN|nr:DUF2630 family protein [Wenjunlia tyrosinilytica]GGO87760.1 hypothetical protein GCM10012280_26970 [Wenjunlia tyrosinilytica]
MADNDIIGRIDELVAEEHELRSRAPGKGLGDAGRLRLREIEGQLDQCWDLLRRRRASAEFGEAARPERPRPVDEVESYLQ